MMILTNFMHAKKNTSQVFWVLVSDVNSCRESCFEVLKFKGDQEIVFFKKHWELRWCRFWKICWWKHIRLWPDDRTSKLRRKLRAAKSFRRPGPTSLLTNCIISSITTEFYDNYKLIGDPWALILLLQECFLWRHDCMRQLRMSLWMVPLRMCRFD